MLAKYDYMLTSPFNLWDSLRTFDSLYDVRTTRSAYDVETSDDGLTLSIELPGATAEDISVSVIEREVTISGKRRGKDFTHTYVLAKSYDTSTADATLANGVLTVKFLRTQASRPQQITIKSG